MFLHLKFELWSLLSVPGICRCNMPEAHGIRDYPGQDSAKPNIRLQSLTLSYTNYTMSFGEARRSILKLSNAHFPDDSEQHTICTISRVSDSTEEIKYSRIVPNDTSDEMVCIHPLLCSQYPF